MGNEFSSKMERFVKALHELSNTSLKILLGIILALLILHLFLSFYLEDFAWLSAFGALLSIFGLLVSFSYALPIGDIDPRDLAPTKEGEPYIFGGSEAGELLDDKEVIDNIKQSNINRTLKNYKNITTYIIFTVVGTLIWAYAGFLNAFFRE